MKCFGYKMFWRRLNAVDCSQNISSSNKAFTLVWRQKVHIFKLFQPVFVLIFIQTFSRSGKHFLSFENFSNNLRPYNLSPFHLKLKTGPSQSRGMLKKRSQVIGAWSTWIFLISILRVLATVKLVTFNVCSDLNHSFCGKSSDDLKRPVHWISFYTVGECFVKIFYYVSQMFNCIRSAFKSDN